MRATGVVGTTMLAMVLGCGEARGPSTPAGTAVEDSAGVTIVHLQGDLAGFARPGVELRRAYRVGEDGSGLELYRVSAARFLTSGDLVIANAGTPELLVLDGDGRLKHRVGEAGEGPGQFGTITSVHVTDAGTVVAYDDRQGRLTEFDSGGALLGTRRMTDPNPVSDLIPLIASMPGPVLAVYGDNRRFGKGGTIRRDTTPLLRFTGSNPVPDTVSRWASKVWSFENVGMGTTRTEPAFSPDLLIAGRSHRAVFADTHEPRVTVVDEEGRTVMSVRWDATPEPVTDADVAAWKNARAAGFSDELPAEVRRIFLNVTHNDTHPLLNGVMVDAEGRVWIAPSELESGNTRTWILLDPDGAARGGMSLPASARILDAAGGRVAVLDRNRLDVEVITVYSLTFPGGG